METFEEVLAHEIELRSTKEQAQYLDKAYRSRRHCYNPLLEHLITKGQRRAPIHTTCKMIRPNFLWHAEISEPGDSRNAIDGLNHAFRKFFTYLKAGKKPDFPRSKKKDVKGSFELREKPKLR